ncbi:CdaR family protein [Olivibacter sitiensis]|uniref:CdaR family protein n=1 Tax=Olivibacter sitiensis TaxID=376470 RepID=UPI0004056D3E|nr:hypothetical protein [Olivibacter sitiensis]
MAIFNLNRTQQQKLTLFVGCIVISFFVWCLFALSNHYQYRVNVALNYVNSPEKRAFHPLQSDTVSMQVEGTGWQVLFSGLRLTPLKVNVDLSGLKSRDWIVFSNQLGYINRQFDANQTVVSVSPDTLYFSFSEQAVKKVPVKLAYDLDFKQQYNVSGEVDINPKFVTVTGPLEDLVQIESWQTDTLKRNNVSENITARLSLMKNKKSNLSVTPTAVEMLVPVDEVTEKIIDVIIKPENAKAYHMVKIIPEKVRLTVMISLNEYKNVNRDAFEAIVNLNDWKRNQVSNLPIIITKQPEFVNIIKIEPQNASFFVRE